MSGEYRSIMVYTGYELVVTNWGSVGSVFLIDGDSPTGKQFVSPNNGNNLQKNIKDHRLVGGLVQPHVPKIMTD